MISPEKIFELKSKIRINRPLIHCIANNVTENFCANAVNVLGAKPIMTEFEREIPEITSAADAVSLNSGTISEDKLRGLSAAGKTAAENGIPLVIDIVGAACSSVRLDFLKKFTEDCSPAVIKGNQSEIFAFCGIPHGASGIDSEGEKISAEAEEIILSAAKKTNSVIMMTGKNDLISDGRKIISVSNGTELMRYVSGTGCVLGAVTGCFLAVSEDPLSAAVSAAVTMGLAGEYAESSFHKNGSISGFAAGIIDGLFSDDKEFFIRNTKFSLIM